MVTRTKQQIGAYSRRKGASFEREIARLLGDWAGQPCRRTPRSGAYGSEGWEALAGDLMFSGAAVPWHIELKRRQGWNWEATLRGEGPILSYWSALCEAAAKTSQAPLLIFKKNRGQIWAGLPCYCDALPACLTMISIREHNLAICSLDHLRSAYSWKQFITYAEDGRWKTND